jgi:replicative superfamily II helicase
LKRTLRFQVVYIAPSRALTSEITSKFKNQLNGLDLNVLMVTGEETPLPNAIEEAQVLVVTPEKWDILTRRYSAWRFVNNVRLMVFDEVHMLQTERGPVLEAIIVRALNEVGGLLTPALFRRHSPLRTFQNQGGKPVRIVGLSATLPNYHDVARFLHVDEQKGLFYFDQRFRAVPLTQRWVVPCICYCC